MAEPISEDILYWALSQAEADAFPAGEMVAILSPSFTLYAYTATGDNSAAWASDYAAAGSPATVDVLVVAGGGSGGSAGSSGGGGGAGGLIWQTGVSVNGSETVTVGAGGAAIDWTVGGVGNPGANSVFGSVTATGGGYGGASSGVAGGPGGSGGGGAGSTTGGAGGAGTGGQGNNGGAGHSAGGAGAADQNGGGGGGAGAAGSAASASSAGPGGAGLDMSANVGTTWGVSGWFAGGGGGATREDGVGYEGGQGGGGNGTPLHDIAPTSGVANTGGGGGGASGDVNSGAGGSGIVIVKVTN